MFLLSAFCVIVCDITLNLTLVFLIPQQPPVILEVVHVHTFLPFSLSPPASAYIGVRIFQKWWEYCFWELDPG